MKMQIQTKSTRRGFTLIEMIGVLAVIAILASLLIPKIFEAINNARISNSLISVNTIKTALADHYAKQGTFIKDGSGGAIALSSGVYANYDGVLLTAGFIDKPFEVKLGTGADVRLVQGLPAADVATGVNAAYNLDGVTSSTAPISVANEAGPDSAIVVEATITGVPLTDALEISKRLDGDNLSETGTATADIRGRVKYALPSSGTTTDLHIYLSHR